MTRELEPSAKVAAVILQCKKSRESIPSVVEVQEPSQATNPDKDNAIQLSRHLLVERLRFERSLPSKVFVLCHLLMVVLLFLQCVQVYDPSEDIAAVHDKLRARYNMYHLDEYEDSPARMLQYVSYFLDVTYSMASALVDANTMNAIDPTRCFDLGTTDICRLSYWEVQSRLKEDEHYVNLDALFLDQVSPKNQEDSRMGCAAEDAKPNCMQWEDHVNPHLTLPVMGLTPEDPVIVEDRKTFPFAQVVPLAPIVWQTRALRAPCSGFGDVYNAKVLGAGTCTPDIRCDPDSVTSFDAPIPNPSSGRKQTVFVAYENDAFGCLDRSKEDDAVFFDRSWDPMASFNDLAVGRRLEAALLGGRSVYYKFISDVRYLMGPIRGTVFINSTDPCQPCEEWSAPECVDPLEVGQDHPMWQEDSVREKCSLRSQWIKRFLDDEQTPDRESTFITPETTEFVLAALVITPQMAALPDITTLVKVRFTRGQSGEISTSPELVSISETPVVSWCCWSVATMLLAIAYAIACVCRKDGGQRRSPMVVMDVGLMLAVCVYLLVNMYLEFSPPHVLEELTAAFEANRQDAYFECFVDLMAYSDGLRTLKDGGFYLFVVLLFRLVVELDVHPRLGLLSRVARECADDVFHFLLQFTILSCMLSFLGFWSFGEANTQFRDFTRSMYTLFGYYVGVFSFAEDPPETKFTIFLIIYVFVMYVMMANFLLAIIVNAHSTVMQNTHSLQIDHNIVVDLWDMCMNVIGCKRRGWPTVQQILAHLSMDLTDSDLMSSPAVTKLELSLARCCTTNNNLFGAENLAQDFIDHYAYKVSSIPETRKDMLFLPGHSYLEEREAPPGNLPMIRQCHPDEGSADTLPEHVRLVRRHRVETKKQLEKLKELKELMKSKQLPHGSGWSQLAGSAEDAPRASSHSFRRKGHSPGPVDTSLTNSASLHEDNVLLMSSSSEVWSGQNVAAARHRGKGNANQLHRHFLVERLGIERALRSRLALLCHFSGVVMFFLQCVNVYDPSRDIAAVHKNLRARYNMYQLDEYEGSPANILEYISYFLDVTYDMASALIDANTMNFIDPTRCFDLETTDICRLSYWEVQSRRKEDEHYVNLDALFLDQVSPRNQKHSRMDCSAQNAEPNCLQWEDHINPNLTLPVMGLTPEDPVIVEDRKTFPFAQVVPLAPIVWQTRALRAPCSGFGDKYNAEILGAGTCTPNIRCDPDSVTSFDAPIPNPSSGRKQTVFVAYENDAFGCLDRSKEDDVVFFDKSWDPMATFKELTVGRRLEAAQLEGRSVYYKFISDVHYLLGPIRGTVVINTTDPCQPCEEWSAPECVDPLEVGQDHPMWQEDSIRDKCSIRNQWIKRFLDDEHTPERESTFITPETTEFVLAVLVITPQMAALPDITTLVKVRFTRGQSGGISASPELVSISETPVVSWCCWSFATMLLAIAYAIDRLRKKGGGQRYSPMTIIDVGLMLAVCVYLLYNMVLEFSPPHVLAELTAAFEANQQDAYFKCFAGLLDYSDGLRTLKNCGFYLILGLLFRLVVELDVHPRLGLLPQVARECADDTFHFLLQFSILFGMLSFLGFWSFGEANRQFRDFGWSSWTLFRYFVGEFAFPQEPPEMKFMVFLIIYVFVMYVIMVNFLLAVLVNAHTIVMQETEDIQTEMNIVVDLVDMCWDLIVYKRRDWPSLEQILDHLCAAPADSDLMSLPAVTSLELGRAHCLQTEDKLFATQELAQEFIDHYASKVSCILETREDMLFLPGHSYLEELEAPPDSLPSIRRSNPETAAGDTLSEHLHLAHLESKELREELDEVAELMKGSEEWSLAPRRSQVN